MQVGDTVTIKAKVLAISADGSLMIETKTGEKAYINESDTEEYKEPEWKSNFMKRFERKL